MTAMWTRRFASSRAARTIHEFFLCYNLVRTLGEIDQNIERPPPEGKHHTLVPQHPLLARKLRTFPR
jgi:hypothetical protein